MKKLIRYITTTLLAVSLLSNMAYADVISDSPFGTSEQTSTVAPPPAQTAAETKAAEAKPAVEITATADGSNAVIGEAPTAGTTGSNSIVAPPQQTAASQAAASSNIPAPVQTQSNVIGPGPGGASSVSTAAPASSGSGVPGARYSNDARVRVNLDFIVVSPQHDYNGYKVAEGGAYLANGSWESIGYNQYLRQPYFKLLREEGDWYIVSVNARRIGNYTTSDGSMLKELWLKKSDCVARNYIELNTGNATRQQIVKNALNLLGKGYQYAGNGPDAYDCSGLVNAVMSASGIKVARNSSEICNQGTQVGIEGLRPGDIVGRSGHVGVYIGDGYFLHAAESSSGVISDILEVYNKSSRFTSYANVVGD